MIVVNLAAATQERVKGLLSDLLGGEFADATPGSVRALVTQTRLVIPPERV